MQTVKNLNLDPEVQLQARQATLRLMRYRKACDKARAQRLQGSPRLTRMIAILLGGDQALKVVRTD
ncbi:MAG: hypothetical protein KDK75_08200 [Alphaproteobacteria bacterium]|nr:hypothetical protein [Alphaproteobacteria bacterium]